MAFLMNGYNFTERVRRILAMTREEAARLHHEYVGTEHILFALVREGEGVGVTVLERLGVNTQAVSRRLSDVVRAGRARSVAGPDLPYTSRAKKVLELSMAEAKGLGHGYVGSEHLLLGIIAEGKGIAGQVLAEAGVTLEAARAEVRRIVEGPEPGVATQPVDASGVGAAKSRPIERVEVILHYRDGGRVQSSFTTPQDALGFLRSADERDRPS